METDGSLKRDNLQLRDSVIDHRSFDLTTNAGETIGGNLGRKLKLSAYIYILPASTRELWIQF